MQEWTKYNGNVDVTVLLSVYSSQPHTIMVYRTASSLLHFYSPFQHSGCYRN